MLGLRNYGSFKWVYYFKIVGNFNGDIELLDLGFRYCLFGIRDEVNLYLSN